MLLDKELKIAVVHDHLGFRGGGERTALILAIETGADFITAYKADDTYSELQKKLGSSLIVLSKKIITTRVARFFWLRFLFWRKRRIFRQYDILVASGQTATEAVANYAKKRAMRIVYTHTTPRRVFDQFEFSRQMYPAYLRPAYTLFAGFWKRLYLNAAARMNYNIANSQHVRQRVKKFTGGDVNSVVWPPIQTDKFRWISQEDYYLSWSRIDEAKRVELAAAAFRAMPDKKLIIASGGPRLEAVKKIAAGAPNIIIKGWASDAELAELVGKCIAAVYIPIDEDAGMTHLEANASGKPYLGVKEGGLVESSVDGLTGLLIKENPGVEDVVAGVKTMTAGWCLQRKEACEEQAKKYDQSIFISKMKSIIRANDPRVPILGIDASRWEDPRYPGQSRRTGVEVVAKNIIERLLPLALEKGIRVRLYTPRTIDGIGLEYQKVLPGNHGWTLRHLANELKHSPIDYFFTSSYYIPNYAPKNSFAVLHDILFRTHSWSYSLSERMRQEYAARQNIKRARHIFTVSEFSKKEIIREFCLKPEAISVISPGFAAEAETRPSVARERYILYIGRIEKKKSVDVLVRAFGIFSESNPDWELWLAGSDGFGNEEIKRIAANSKAAEKIKFLGYIDDKKKWDLLSRAGIYVHPSSLEGSCLPMLEAWQAGTPVITADTELMREIGGNAVLYFKTSEFNQLAGQMQLLANNPDKIQELRLKGTESLDNHSWDNAARQIIDVILSHKI